MKVKNTSKGTEYSRTTDPDFRAYRGIKFHRIRHLYMPVHGNKSWRTMCVDLG